MCLSSVLQKANSTQQNSDDALQRWKSDEFLEEDGESSLLSVPR